jgi:hypothetical protein
LINGGKATVSTPVAINSIPGSAKAAPTVNSIAAAAMITILLFQTDRHGRQPNFCHKGSNTCDRVYWLRCRMVLAEFITQSLARDWSRRYRGVYRNYRQQPIREK